MSDEQWLLHELGGKHRAQVLSTLASLGVVELLCEAPRPVAELAAAIGADAAGLESLLRAAAGIGVLCEPEPGHFAATARGELLQRERLGAFAAFLGSPSQWDPWSRLRDALRGGTGGATAFERTFGHPLYEHLRDRPAVAAAYDEAIDAFTRREAQQFCQHLDLAGRRRLVDVGGGRGTLLRELLPAAARDARGVLFDLPHVVEQVRPSLPAGIDAVAGDFFEAVPDGGDVYLVKRVLHNWDDARAVQILRNCCAVRARDGLVVVIDAVLAPDNRPDLARMLDLEMRVLCGGRERRKPELRRLIADAGLVVRSACELEAGAWMFVCS